MPQKIEKKLVEDFAVQKLQELGWQFVEPTELKRESIKEPLLIDDLKRTLFRLNEDLGITEDEVNKVIGDLQLLPSDQEGAKKLLSWLKYGIGVKFEEQGVVKYIQLFDFKNLGRNEFIFSRQVHYKGIETRIPDIVLYINGIPLAQIECKNPASIRTGWEEGYLQIKEYENVIPEFYKYVQIGISLAEKARYFPIVPWQKEVRTYLWRQGEKPEDEAIFEMLKPEVFLDILRNFLFVRDERGEVTKVITRYMQYWAVNKIFQLVVDNLEGKSDKNKGLVWHWQGSGKTLTMIFTAHKLYFEEKLGNPSIFFIIDRRDLEEQLNGELGALKLNFSFEKVERVKKLKEIIAFDNFRGKRGIFITLIHKFQPSEKFLPDDFKEGNREIVANRKNIVCFLDEVHRSQYGLLAGQMKDVLKNAYFFGFTGTPISETDKNTYREFGYPIDKEPYLDKYFIDDSQKDGFTIPIVYEPRLEDLHLEKTNLNLFLSKQFEGEDLDEIQKERISEAVRKKINYVNAFLENEEQISKKAADIAEHFKKHLDDRFKGMVVAGSRKACVLYKKHLDKHLPPEYSEVVITFNQNEKEKLLRDFYKEWRSRYKGAPDDEKVVQGIVENYKNKETPKILIVMDMLITGFDAPILQTIYLDRFLRKHKLLQAIARVNRPFKDVKGAGLIIDYVGILKEFKAALGEYYKEKIGDLFIDFDSLFKIFKDLIGNLKDIFSGIDFKIERKELIAAVERLRNEENERVFIETYKKARKIFETLGSFERKLDYLNEFKWLTVVYEYYLKLKVDEEEKKKIDHYFKETVKTIHDNVTIKDIEQNFRRTAIDLDYLKKLEKSQLNKEEKAINILFSLERLILVHQNYNPVYRSIADTIEELVKKWRERLIDYDELAGEERKIVNYIEKQEKTREELKLTPFEFSLLLILKEKIKIKEQEILVQLTKGLVNEIRENLLIDDWQENPVLRQNVLRKSREFTVKLKQNYKFSIEVMDDLHKKLIEIIQNYGNAKSISV